MHIHSAVDLIRMARSIRHRGPDDEGFALIDTATGKEWNASGRESNPVVRENLPVLDDRTESFPHNLALSHRRYSIVDLSPSGHQPMWDSRSEVCVSFNGEIYNYIELREELGKVGHRFSTNTDTEVLLKGYIEWGTDVFQKLTGPWALALYDKNKKKVLLSRDRIGKMPLYYAVRGNQLYWASEIKAILQAQPAFTMSIREQAIDDFLIHGWRDIDGTFWKDIHDFPPASYAWVENELTLSIHPFWQLPETRLNTNEISIPEARSKLQDTLSDAVRIRLRSDIPVAFELSGGMDSSSLVALATGHSKQPLDTYTVRFSEAGANEEPFARMVADLYSDNINYKVIQPGPNDFWQGANNFIWLQEEPFHSPNVFTTHNLRKLIKNDGAGVLINGAGGDEVFAGYSAEYFIPYLRYLFHKGKLHSVIRELMSYSETTISRFMLKRIKNAFTLRPPKDNGASTNQILKDIYLKGSNVQTRAPKSILFSNRMKENMTHRMMNYWLRVGNKSTYGIPLEPRLPFLDHRIVELGFTLPPEYLIHHGWHKWILREATKKILPKGVVWRKQKMGFPFPMAEWLATSKPIAQKLLMDVECPYFNFSKLPHSYDDLLVKNPNILWRLIILGLWWKRVIQNDTVADLV
jgi:asparagine synthase (glutamine-hydrolysing)